jgi:ubiquinone/menaquinone biosynthesis C-methylase UbiE
MLTKIFGPIINGSPLLKRTVWRRWYEFLARGYKQEDWTFMNYGYADMTDPKTGLTVPQLKLSAEEESDRCSIQLYHQVAGDTDLRDKVVAEIGSGRGGGSSFIARHRQPKSMLGIDFSDAAVDFSTKRHNVPNLKFQQGDAESLPFPDATFDAILNVESSHCYGSMERFLSEVHRTLKPGGYFLWADFRPNTEREAVRAQFRTAGFELKQETNITPNVVHALDQVKDKKQATISRYVPKYLMPAFEDFAGVPGTRVYESFRRGDVEYWRCAMQKPLS